LSPETSIFKLKTPGKFPEKYKLHSEHGESLKTTIRHLSFLLTFLCVTFKQLYLHTHWKLDTYLYELIYSELSILPPPKIYAIPPETPCICTGDQ